MSIYTSNEDPIFDSLKTYTVDNSILEPINTDCSGIYNTMYGKKHTEEAKQIMRERKIGMVTVKDSLGNNLSVHKDDPRFKSRELVGIAKDKISVKNIEGNKFLVNKDDPRYLSGELIGVNNGSTWKQKVPSPHKGTILVKNKDGLMYRMTKDDPRYVSGEFIHFRKKF